MIGIGFGFCFGQFLKYLDYFNLGFSFFTYVIKLIDHKIVKIIPKFPLKFASLKHIIGHNLFSIFHDQN